VSDNAFAEALLSVLATAVLLGILSLPFICVMHSCERRCEEPKSEEDEFLDSVEEQRKRAVKARHEEERRQLAERHAAEKRQLEEEFEREERERLAKYRDEGTVRG